MGRNSYRGGSSLIGWSSDGYRDSLKPKKRRPKAQLAAPAVRAKMAQLDRQAAKAEAAREKILGEVKPKVRRGAEVALSKRKPNPIKRVQLGGLTDEERAAVRSTGRMQRVIVEKKGS